MTDVPSIVCDRCGYLWLEQEDIGDECPRCQNLDLWRFPTFGAALQYQRDLIDRFKESA